MHQLHNHMPSGLQKEVNTTLGRGGGVKKKKTHNNHEYFLNGQNIITTWKKSKLLSKNK